MRHADDHFLHPGGAGALDQVVEHGNHRVAALAGEALLADVLRAQVALQRLGGGQPLQDVLAELRRIRRPRAQRLEALLDEALLRRIGHVHVLGAEGAAVGLLQRRDQVAQAHLARPAGRAAVRADVELRLQVGIGEAVAADVQVGDVRLLLPLQRIEVGLEHPEGAVLADQPQHQHLLVHGLRVDHRRGQAPALRELDERIDDRRVRHVLGAVAQLIEIRAPVGADRTGVGQVDLVLLLDERRVAPEQGRRPAQLVHHASLGLAVPGIRASAARSASRRGAAPRCRAGAGGRSSARDRRSSRSIARSSPPCAPARRSP